jgi:hypothetical protein
MTRSLFFTGNEWVLHVTSSFNAISWITQYWGPEALSLMRDVRIEIYGIGIQSQLLEIEFTALETFVQAAKEGKMLRSLAVQWIQQSPPLGCAVPVGGSWHFHPVERDRGLERNGEGGRGLIVSAEEARDLDDDNFGTQYLGPQSEVEDWKADEVVLLPLGELRGIPKARIEGTVTEEWALWLERAMSAHEGQAVPQVAICPRAKEVIRRLRNGTEDDGL